MSNDLFNIRDRYRMDLVQINDYIQYVETFFETYIKMNSNIQGLSPTFSKNPSISNICDNNLVILNEMLSYSKSLQKEIDELDVKERNPDDPTSDDPTPQGDILLYLCTELHKVNKDKQELIQTAKSIVEAMCIAKDEIEGFEEYSFLYDNPTEIERLVDLAFEENKRRKLRSLSSDQQYTIMSVNALDLFDFTNQLNIYRQNFIQTMAYFDSCIFDMVRVCMENNFFEWIAYFADEKIKTHNMAESGDFETFKNSHIEKTLKKCYVKDLLKILYTTKKDIFNINGVDVYSEIQEMIGRRNVHIHHNGCVDKAYLLEFNIFDTSLGDYLKIDKGYFSRAISLTAELVSAIATRCS